VGQFDHWTEFPRRSLPFSRRPFRLDLYAPLAAACIVAKATPLPPEARNCVAPAPRRTQRFDNARNW